MDETFQFLSTLEKKVYLWLTGKQIAFVPQQKMFGYAEAGSAIVDFVIPDRMLALRVMGSYFHSSLEAKARDEFGKEQLVNQGYIVVDLWEEALGDDRIDSTMQLALMGIEVFR